MLDLTDKRVIVTGGASGIGLMITKKLLAVGATVIILDKNDRAGRLVESKFAAKFEKRIKFIKTDVCDRENVDKSIDQAMDTFHTIDVLINNAGDILIGGILETTEEQWDYLVNINLKSLYYTCRKIVPVFVRRQKGNIINMSSIFAVQGMGGVIGYTTTKTAVIGFTRALAGELAKKNIRVNCISPGVVMTPLYSRAGVDKKAFINGEGSNAVGDPADIAKVVCFLASDDSRWITGANIPVDGGFNSIMLSG